MQKRSKKYKLILILILPIITAIVGIAALTIKINNNVKLPYYYKPMGEAYQEKKYCPPPSDADFKQRWNQLKEFNEYYKSYFNEGGSPVKYLRCATMPIYYHLKNIFYVLIGLAFLQFYSVGCYRIKKSVLSIIIGLILLVLTLMIGFYAYLYLFIMPMLPG